MESTTTTSATKPSLPSKGKLFGPTITGGAGTLCEHIIVLNKRDLVAEDKFEVKILLYIPH